MGATESSVAVLGQEVYAEGIRSTLARCGLSVEYPNDVGTWSERISGVPVVIASLAALNSASSANGGMDKRCIVIATAINPSPQVFVAAFRAGASAVVDPSQGCSDLIAAVEAALDGCCRLPVSVARWFAEHSPPVCPVELSGEELRLVRVLAHGDSIARTADHLGYSERSMHRILRKLYDRLGAHNRSEAIMLVAAWGLLDVPSERATKKSTLE